MLKYFHRSAAQKDIHEHAEFVLDCWIYAENLAQEEIDFLVEKFALEEGHLLDALDPFEVPRIEKEDGVLYVFMRLPVKEKENAATLPVTVVIAENFILTISQKRNSFLEKFVHSGQHVYTKERVDFFLRMMLAAGQEYRRYLVEISKEVRHNQGHLEKLENKVIVRFVEYERILNDFVGALIPMGASLRTLLKGKLLVLPEEGLDMAEDVLLESEQNLEMAKTTLKNIQNIRDAYSTIMTQDLNRVMKILTALTIIITVPTTISSFYGMNVRLPFDQSPVAYVGIALVTILVTGSLFAVFVRNRWL